MVTKKKKTIIIGMYNVYVEDFMIRDVKYIWHGISYQKLKDILKENRKLRGFPLVDNPDSMILLGSIQRLALIKLIEKHIGRERRLQVTRTSSALKAHSPSYFLFLHRFIIGVIPGRAKMAQGGGGESARGNRTTAARAGKNEEAFEI